MFWKDELAKDILDAKNVSKTWLVSLSDKYPSLRVKTVDASGRVPVIQLNGQGEWLKPKEWADIHVANLKQRHLELHQRLATVGCDPSHTSEVSGCSDSAVTQSQSDPSELEQLRTNFQELIDSYGQLVTELGELYQGKAPNLTIQSSVADMLAESTLRPL